VGWIVTVVIPLLLQLKTREKKEGMNE
jgi:hypothetical protein